MIRAQASQLQTQLIHPVIVIVPKFTLQLALIKIAGTSSSSSVAAEEIHCLSRNADDQSMLNHQSAEVNLFLVLGGLWYVCGCGCWGLRCRSGVCGSRSENRLDRSLDSLTM